MQEFECSRWDLRRIPLFAVHLLSSTIVSITCASLFCFTSREFDAVDTYLEYTYVLGVLEAS